MDGDDKKKSGEGLSTDLELIHPSLGTLVETAGIVES